MIVKSIHILLFVLIVFLFYHLMNNCGCYNGVNNRVVGFSVGGQRQHGNRYHNKKLELNNEKCIVGQDVSCPKGKRCAGNQCCPDGSICPSADNKFKGCSKSKSYDCTKPLPPLPNSCNIETLQKCLNTKNCENNDLSNCDLSDADLSGANLRNANLSGANLYGVNLSDADLSIADLSNADLRYVSLTSASLTNASLTNADLRYSIFNDDINGANLTGANLSNANITKARAEYSIFNNANLTNTNFESISVANSSFINASLINVNFVETYLKNADFRGAYLNHIHCDNMVPNFIKDAIIDPFPNGTPASYRCSDEGLWHKCAKNRNKYGHPVCGS